MSIDTMGKDPRPSGHHPSRSGRKLRKKGRRLENQTERTRIREHLREGLRDPDRFLDLARERKNTRRLLESGTLERRELLESQKQKVRSELRGTRDLDTFLEKTSRSKTLHALVAMAFFRHVRDSGEFEEESRFKQAIRQAMEDPDLSRAIQRKWETFDKEFPGRHARSSW